MYARYAYVQGALPANILSDVCALLTGTTDKALLSAACDQSITEIAFGINPATWVMHDNAATATGKVLKQTCADGVTIKYMHIAAANSNVFTIGGSETWNAATHTGTYGCQTPDANGFSTASAYTGSIFNASTYTPSSAPGFLILYSDPYATMVVAKSVGTMAFIANLEFSRSGPLMSLSDGYPCWLTSGRGLIRARAKNQSGAGDTAYDNVSCKCVIMYATGNSTIEGINNTVRLKDESVVYPVYQLSDFPIFGVSNTFNIRDYLGNCLTQMKIIAAASAGTTFDELTINGVAHVKIATTNNTFMPTDHLLFPKG